MKTVLLNLSGLFCSLIFLQSNWNVKLSKSIKPKLSNVPNNDDKLDKGKDENIQHCDCESTLFLVQLECRINEIQIQKI